MKVNLTIKPSDVSGYLNINAVEGGDIASFDNMVSDSEAVEILATDIINFVSMEKVEELIDGWIKKLRHGGKLVIGGVDAFEVCRAVSHTSLSIEEFNQIIHEGRSSQISISELSEILSRKGLTILKRRLSGFNMIVEAQRP